MPESKKKTRGRQKTPGVFIEKYNSRRQSFKKRSQGLFKKALEMEIMCRAFVRLEVVLDEGKGKSYSYRYHSGGTDNRLPKMNKSYTEGCSKKSNNLSSSFSGGGVLVVNSTSSEMTTVVEDHLQGKVVELKDEVCLMETDNSPNDEIPRTSSSSSISSSGNMNIDNEEDDDEQELELQIQETMNSLVEELSCDHGSSSDFPDHDCHQLISTSDNNNNNNNNVVVSNSDLGLLQNTLDPLFQNYFQVAAEDPPQDQFHYEQHFFTEDDDIFSLPYVYPATQSQYLLQPFDVDSFLCDESSVMA